MALQIPAVFDAEITDIAYNGHTLTFVANAPNFGRLSLSDVVASELIPCDLCIHRDPWDGD